MIYSNKIAVRNLVEICAQKGIKHVVISPGSRNAPLSITFNRHKAVECHVIVDERSAAFFALGLAQQTQKTVVLVCTSGTAALNYAPAIAEAYYQKIPLLILTADRPLEWVDQMDGQTIRQNNIFCNYIKKSFQLPTEPSNEDEIWHSNRICSEAIESTHYPESGPVHINIPFREPLYQTKDYTGVPLPKTFSTITTLLELPDFEVQELQKKWQSYSKILIVTGLLHPNPKINEYLGKISHQKQVAILTETTSNLFGDNFNRSIDRLIVGIENQNPTIYQADLLITLGGPVVSKKIKAFLRENPPKEHWHVNASNDYIDTYKNLSKIIPISPEKFLVSFTELDNLKGTYNELWRNLDDKLLAVFKKFMSDTEFSDLKVFDAVLQSIPKLSNVQLANSTSVRYSNLFDTVAKQNLFCFGNRGTSGIDGTISTAVGAAIATPNKITTVITGDLSFLDDSNAWWIKPMPQNLRIIVINNQGGNIFRIIDGPASTPELESYFEAKHDLSFEHLCKAFSLDYFVSSNSEGLNQNLATIFNSNCKKTCVLEIKTSNQITPLILKEYFKHLKQAI